MDAGGGLAKSETLGRRNKRRRWPLLLLLALALSGAVVYRLVDPAQWIAAQQATNDRVIREGLAHHIGTLAYIYGYPIVDMTQQMHNETHRVATDQQVLAPVNRIFRYPGLVTPTTQGNLRMPNHDTLYFSGWYDVSREPLILHTPDTHGRYFSVAVTNLYAEVEQLGRRTTGTAERYFALVPPGFSGALPRGVTPVVTESSRGWLLGRMLVSGESDAPAAMALVNEIWTAPLSEFTPGQPPPLAEEPRAAPMAVMEDLAFFEVLNAALRELPPRASEAALMAQLDAIGLGPARDFDVAQLDPDTRRGLERALEDGRALVRASARRTLPSQNGWIISHAIGRYGFDYLQRAATAFGGYGNLPEESLYPAALVDSAGKLLTGSKRYRMRFAAGGLPPVNAFWSLSVYDIRTARLIENPVHRYSFGDRSPGIATEPDGSLTIALQRDDPKDASVNWLPTPSGPFIAIMRLYEPKAAALSGEYRLPRIDALE